MRHQRFLDISQAPDLAAFERLLVRFANDLDFGIMAAGLAIDRPGKGPGGDFLNIGNVSAEYGVRAKGMVYAGRDPVLQRLKKSHLPFTYDQGLYIKEDAADLWEFQAPYGLANGIAVALHLPGNKHFLLGFDRAEPLPEDEHLTRMLGALQLLAVHAQDAALRLLGVHEDHPLAVTLTVRELEVLRWTMEGKSAWEAGEIMNISQNTVAFHLRNIFRKLESTSKHQAVLKALALGLL